MHTKRKGQQGPDQALYQRMYPTIRRRYAGGIFQYGTINEETGYAPSSMQDERDMLKYSFNISTIGSKKKDAVWRPFFLGQIILELILISHKFLIHSIVQEHKNNLHQHVYSPKTHSHVSHNGMAEFIEPSTVGEESEV